MKCAFVCLCVFCLGVFIGVIGLQLRSAAGYWRGLPEPSSSTNTMPMVERSYDPAKIRSGEPQVSSVVFSHTAGGSTAGGIWECVGPAVIDVSFGADERLYVLEGRVDVEYLGNRFSLNSGDAAFFQAGTTAVWTIESRLKKAWVQHNPGGRTRSLRWLSGSRP